MGNDDEVVLWDSTMKIVFVPGPADRRRRLCDPKRVRKWLNTPREAATPEQEKQIWRNLFALYSIPPSWPAEVQLIALAARLAEEVFPGAKALWKPAPSKRRRKK